MRYALSLSLSLSLSLMEVRIDPTALSANWWRPTRMGKSRQPLTLAVTEKRDSAELALFTWLPLVVHKSCTEGVHHTRYESPRTRVGCRKIYNLLRSWKLQSLYTWGQKKTTIHADGSQNIKKEAASREPTRQGPDRSPQTPSSPIDVVLNLSQENHQKIMERF